MKVKIVNKSRNELPEYATIGSAGMDLRAELECETLVLEPRKQQIISTGLYIQLPDGFIDTYTGEGWGYEAQIRPRSGLAAKNGIIVVNTPGTIDSDYRGEIKVILMNLTDEPFTIHHGDRIAQMVINRYERISWVKVDELDETKRNSGGFGHTGTK